MRTILKPADLDQIIRQSRAHFLATAARSMRERLLDRARRLSSQKRDGGLTIEETAEVLGVSPRTVRRAWTAARAWMSWHFEEGR